jgi:flagellar hook assembly protein FlgD
VDWSLVNLSSENNIVSILPELYQNYPNPFKPAVAGRSPTTTISFNISRKDAKVEIYNIKGEKVRTLHSFPNRSLGTRNVHTVTWNGADDNNKPVSSGIYFYKLRLPHNLSGKTGNYSNTKKMILLR